MMSISVHLDKTGINLQSIIDDLLFRERERLIDDVMVVQIEKTVIPAI